jgi:class 3 adenylate cyclase
VAGERYADRVRDLLSDAGAAAAARDWAAVRDLAGAVLALSPGDPGAQALLEEADRAEPAAGERRQLTVMFCDVVGSTALSQEHDPELVREVLRGYQGACDRVVRRYEGRIARYVGDGVLAYFGHPVPHEDDARRGVKAGLDLLEALRPVVDEVRTRYGVDLRIRVAVHTGLVVLSDMGTSATPDRDAIVGDTPNIAARLQDHAQPGTVLISHDTYELVRSWFLVAPVGPVELRGIGVPVSAYQVVAETPEDERVQAQVDLSPFVGRDDELAVLLDAWDEVRAGGSRALAISGQPGVGKTRLADVLRRRVEADHGTARLMSCSAFHGGTALHPVRRLVERVAGIEPHQRDDSKVPWPSAATIALDRLSASELADLARRSPDGRRLEEEHLDHLIQRSDGIPLYLEELLRNARAANATTTVESNIPAALRDLLLARFAGPGVDLRLAQQVATIGHEAPLPLIAEVSRLDPGRLDDQLGALVDAGIVIRVPGDPVSFRFRHHLLQELAYDTQLQTARRQGHSDVADALISGPSEIPATAPTVVAHHLEQAGRSGEAIRFLTVAAEAAHQLGANAEVAELLARAMALLDSVDPEDRNRLEFDVRLVRGANAASIMGFAAPQAVEDFTVCQELVGSQVGAGGYLDDDDAVGAHQVMWSASGLWANLLLGGDLAGADRVNRDLVAQLDPDGEYHRYFATGRAYIDFFEGRYGAALLGLEHAERLIPSSPLPIRLTVPSDPRLTNRAHLAFVLGVQCRCDEARAHSDAGIELATGVDFPVGPFSLCYLLAMRVFLELLAGDAGAATARTDELLGVADRHGFTFWTVLGGFYDAFHGLRRGEEGAAQRCDMSLMLMQSVGVEVWLPYFHAQVAAELLAQGQPEPAADHVAQGAAVASSTGAHYWTPELTRLEGAARLAQGDAGGEALVRAAVDDAVARQATIHELWARTSLLARTGAAAEREGLAALLERLGPGAPPADAAVARPLQA